MVMAFKHRSVFQLCTPRAWAASYKKGKITREFTPGCKLTYKITPRSDKTAAGVVAIIFYWPGLNYFYHAQYFYYLYCSYPTHALTLSYFIRKRGHGDVACTPSARIKRYSVGCA
jgi:hypothetical protein